MTVEVGRVASSGMPVRGAATQDPRIQTHFSSPGPGSVRARRSEAVRRRSRAALRRAAPRANLRRRQRARAALPTAPAAAPTQGHAYHKARRVRDTPVRRGRRTGPDKRWRCVKSRYNSAFGCSATRIRPAPASSYHQRSTDSARIARAPGFTGCQARPAVASHAGFQAEHVWCTPRRGSSCVKVRATRNTTTPDLLRPP